MVAIILDLHQTDKQCCDYICNYKIKGEEQFQLSVLFQYDIKYKYIFMLP